jgi:hypothetical protein
MLRALVPRPAAFPKVIWPALKLVVPVYVLLPDKVNVPCPTFNKVIPVPEITPDKAPVSPVPMSNPAVALALTLMLFGALILLLIATYVLLAICSVPDDNPRAPLFAKVIWPAFNDVPPEYVFEEFRSKIPEPIFVNVPEPETTPVSVNKVPVLVKVLTPERTILFATFNDALAARVVPVDMLRSPDVFPSPVEFTKVICPAFKAVPPE